MLRKNDLTSLYPELLNRIEICEKKNAKTNKLQVDALLMKIILQAPQFRKQTYSQNKGKKVK